MTDVFISYSREDRPRVQVIAQALERAGLKVWWDPHIKTGSGFREEITASLGKAEAVIVVWSQYSVSSRFVCDEADEGAARGILFPALVDLVDIPLGFRQIQTADLTHWRGRPDDKALLEFVSLIADYTKQRLTQNKAPEPEPEEPQTVEQEIEEEDAPASPPPPPPRRRKEPKAKPAKAPRAKEAKHFVTGQRLRMALLWRAIALTLLVAGAFGYLAYHSDFIYPAYRPFIVGAIALLVFISRLGNFEADRSGGVASLRLLSRSYIGLLLFSMISIAPAILEGRLYTEALKAVQIKGISGSNINGVSFSHSGKMLATASDDGTARVWDAASGAQLAILTGHQNWVWSAKFSPDEKSVVTASRDLTAKIWDAQSGDLRLTLKGHTASVLDADFHPSSHEIVTASADGTLRIWDSDSGDQKRTMNDGSRVNALAVSTDGNTIASADTSGTVRLWRWSTGTNTAALGGAPGMNFFSVALDDKGRRVAAAGENGEAYVWSVGSRERIARVNHGAKVFAIAFIGDHELATGGIDSVVRIWDLRSSTLERELTGHLGAVRALAVSPDGKLIATGSRDNTGRIWDIASGNEVQIVGHINGAFHSPVVLDLPPVVFANRAPTPANLIEHPKRLGYLIGKGIVLALATLIIGLLLKGIAALLHLSGPTRWITSGVLALACLYILAVMLTDLPIEASYLWVILMFLPAAIFSLLLWLARSVFVRRRVIEKL
ncbi:MAG: TIR domain-containing protein [Alphaproteobacteria bacterium]